MESKEKCEEIIEMFNGHSLPGAKDALLVKFADGGNKKRSMYRPDQRMWRGDGSEVSILLKFMYLLRRKNKTCIICGPCRPGVHKT